MGKRKSVSFSSVPGENIKDYSEKAKQMLLDKFGNDIINDDGTFKVKIRVIFETKPQNKKDSVLGEVKKAITVNTAPVIPTFPIKNIIVEDKVGEVVGVTSEEIKKAEEVTNNEELITEVKAEEVKSEEIDSLSEDNQEEIKETVIVYDDEFQ